MLLVPARCPITWRGSYIWCLVGIQRWSGPYRPSLRQRGKPGYRRLYTARYCLTGSVVILGVQYNTGQLTYSIIAADTNLVTSLKTLKFRDNVGTLSVIGLMTQSCDLYSTLFQLSEALSSVTVSNAETLATMRRCWEENNHLVCPHTAVAAKYHYDVVEG